MALKCRTSPSPLILGLHYLKQCVGGRDNCDKALNVNRSEMVISADLGSSSNYSNELHVEFPQEIRP